ncbi:MAG: arylsulfatase [Candidatus Hydrogenedentes bacterium]|nr:arylsulfatase [Candidatus Hydrogenedentota bacterium]
MSSWDRRQFLQASALGVAGTALGCAGLPRAVEEARRPNVLIIITDDQGYGDLACHGNPHVRTPNLDRLHDESVRLSNFYVCPVCSPTRSSLMTGRYNYRTGVVDTFQGRSMMHPDEVTLAEVLRGTGYRTGIFGKWHLGDNYPLRAMDQGFEESLVLKGGGLAQPSDFPPGGTYFDPILLHNGQAEQRPGYCTDIFAAAAIEFIKQHQHEPFFTYLATNAPHTPLQVDDKYVASYRDMGLEEDTAKTYGMIANLDENVGRVLQALDDLGLRENTLVWFLTDNGGWWKPEAPRYSAGMRGTKTTVYEGGIHVPSFIRWPRFGANADIPTVAAHIDILPTVLEICGAPLPQDRKIDGRSLVPLLTGAAGAWPERTLFFQWHRGDVPEAFKNCAARDARYKLVDGKELYDLLKDPGETTDISSENPEMVARLRQEYEAWFADVSAERQFAPPRIPLGTVLENPVLLTSQDWRGEQRSQTEKSAYWEVFVATDGQYEITLDFADKPAAGKATLNVGGVEVEQEFIAPLNHWRFGGLSLSKGDTRLEFLVQGETSGVRYVHVRKL